jgi:hypothetical protein
MNVFNFAGPQRIIQEVRASREVDTWLLLISACLFFRQDPRAQSGGTQKSPLPAI